MIRRLCSWPMASGALLVAAASTLPGQTRQQTPPIEVGREVMVSGPDTMSAYSEYDADIDPTNPNRMIVCAQPYVPSNNERKGTVHISSDGGKTWRLALEVPPARPGLTIGDPTCAFALDGTAIFSILYENEDGNLGGAGIWDKWIGATGQLITRSTDGGKT